MSCIWHWLKGQPIDVQVEWANKRLAHHDSQAAVRMPRVNANLWPDGERWCAGCQSFVPLFYASGSRCRACASQAAHASRIKATYGLNGEEYEALLRFQGGVCYICHRVPRSKRLAVDHDHATGEVRGLLCADSERGCNHAILGNVTSLDMARRIPEYLENPPYRRMLAGDAPEPSRLDATEQLKRMVLGSQYVAPPSLTAFTCTISSFHPDFCGCPR
jgi:hypothetical protein